MRTWKKRQKENSNNSDKKAFPKNRRVCSNGHIYYKSSDCPVCPLCEKQRKPDAEFLYAISAPARRALENKGIKTLKQLSALGVADILILYGIGPSTIPKLKKALSTEGLSLKSKSS